jgi:hypothetical protein
MASWPARDCSISLPNDVGQRTITGPQQAGPKPAPDATSRHKPKTRPGAAAGGFVAGFGVYAIAERLTADGIPCPSVHDPDRNRHRSGVAWSKYAIRAILTNPRYTGRQVWNRQRKDEVLIDVHDVALGHTTKMRWNDQDQWIHSDEAVHPAIIDAESFDQAQELLTARRGTQGEHKPHRSRHHYALHGLLFCGVCDRRMQRTLAFRQVRLILSRRRVCARCRRAASGWFLPGGCDVRISRSTGCGDILTSGDVRISSRKLWGGHGPQDDRGA